MSTVIFVLESRRCGNAHVLSTHLTLAGARRRAKAYGGHRGMVWTEHDSHGKCWESVVGDGCYVVHEMEIEP